jgi:hypothetical protein
VWRPAELSNSFHGRDLFAPVAARIAADGLPPGHLRPLQDLATSFGADDLPEIIYIDHYGNACTGIRAARARHDGVLLVGDERIYGARVFADAPLGTLLWHANSHGLVEIAANCGSAARVLRLQVGDRVNWAG